MTTSCIPQHYNVFLKPFIESGANYGTFKGNVEIWMMCESSTNQIKLQSSMLNLHTSSIQVRRGNMDGLLLDVSSVAQDIVKDTMTIQLKEAVLKGSLLYVSISYNGTLNHSDSRGFLLMEDKRNGVTK